MPTELPPMNQPSAYWTPAQPVLYLAMGPLADKSFAELPKVAKAMRVRIAGPLGAFTLGSADGGGEIFQACLHSGLPELGGESEPHKASTPAPTWEASLRSHAGKPGLRTSFRSSANASKLWSRTDKQNGSARPVSLFQGV